VVAIDSINIRARAATHKEGTSSPFFIIYQQRHVDYDLFSLFPFCACLLACESSHKRISTLGMLVEGTGREKRLWISILNDDEVRFVNPFMIP